MQFLNFWNSARLGLTSHDPFAAHHDREPVRESVPLDRVPTGLACRVVAVRAPDNSPDWGRWLCEIGFMPGESVAVTTRGAWGGDPLVVRIGDSTFALRRAEAACVRVQAL